MLAQAIKRRMSKEENQKGFTLIELLAVIVILGIIAVIAIPMIGNVISGAKADSDVATARQVYDAARLYVIGENKGDFKIAKGVDVAKIIEKGYLDEIYLPSTKEEIKTGTVNFSETGQLTDTAKDAADAVVLNKSKFSAKIVLTSEKADDTE